MPFTNPGRDITLLRNKATGLFDMQWDSTGNPIYGDDASHVVMSLLLEHRGRWFADDTGKRGSNIYQLKQDVRATASLIKSYADEALKYGVQTGQLLSFENSVEKQGPGKYKLTVFWEAPNGETGYIPIPLGG